MLGTHCKRGILCHRGAESPAPVSKPLSGSIFRSTVRQAEVGLTPRHSKPPCPAGLGTVTPHLKQQPPKQVHSYAVEQTVPEREYYLSLTALTPYRREIHLSAGVRHMVPLSRGWLLTSVDG